MKRVTIYLMMLVTLVTAFFFACHNDPGAVIELSDSQKTKFPRAYYAQDTIYVVYSDSLVTDTFLLIGEKVDNYLTPDNHHIGGGGSYQTMAENISKIFESSDLKQKLEVTMTTEDYYKAGFGERLYVVYNKLYIYVLLDKIKETTEDQLLKSEYTYHTLTYNIVEGLRKIEITNVKNPYTLTFLP